MYSEKTTKFCEIIPLLLTTVHTVKSKGKISQNFVAFSEYMNFKTANLTESPWDKNKGSLIAGSFSLCSFPRKTVPNHCPQLCHITIRSNS